MLPVEQPFKTYTGLDGKPLNNGFVYFGLPNQNPANESQRVTVYWDAAGTIPADQPLRTSNGYIVRAGTPANVFFDGSYSELVRDSKNRQVFYARNSDEFSIAAAILNFLTKIAGETGAELMSWIQDGYGAVKQTVQAKLRRLEVDVEEFGAVGDGVADDWKAINDCLNEMEARGGNVTVRMSRRYRITKGIKIPSFVRIKGPMPSRYPFNNGTPAPAIVADFTDAEQWVVEPRSKSGGATVAYDTVLTSLPDGAAFNVGIEDLLITSTGVTPFGGVRIHGCPGAVVKNVSILNTGIGLLINESFGCDFQVHTQTLYYGVIGWGEVNACTIDAYCTQATPKSKIVPSNYVFPAMNSLNGAMVGIGLATESHYNRAFGMVFGAPFNATSSNNEIGFTSEYFSGGVFVCNARSTFFSRLYAEGGAGEVDYGIVCAYASMSSAATHAFFSGTGTLLDIGANANVDLNLNGVISYTNFKPVGTISNSSRLTVHGAKMAGVGLAKPEVNVTFPDDGGEWITPEFLPGWSNGGTPRATTQYRLNPYSRDVELKGVPIGGVDNQPVFILPPGYRPLESAEFPVTLFGAPPTTANVIVLATGEVIPANTGMAANGFSLRPVRFRAEQ